jgi:hypothetical protein
MTLLLSIIWSIVGILCDALLAFLLLGMVVGLVRLLGACGQSLRAIRQRHYDDELASRVRARSYTQWR